MARLVKGSCFLVFVIASIAAIGTAPQQPAASASPAPQASPSAPGAPPKAPVYETATVLKAITRLVVADARATDKKGEPVTDLERADFTLLGDGTEHPTRRFHFRHPARAASG